MKRWMTIIFKNYYVNGFICSQYIYRIDPKGNSSYYDENLGRWYSEEVPDWMFDSDVAKVYYSVDEPRFAENVHTYKVENYQELKTIDLLFGRTMLEKLIEMQKGSD